jgi:hypothetical protein
MAINKRNEDGYQQEERGWQLTRGTRMAINKRNEDGNQQEERGWLSTRETRMAINKRNEDGNHYYSLLVKRYRWVE